jgi:hypothetical protein
MKYENCYLSYANGVYFTARSLLQQQTTPFALQETDYYNESDARSTTHQRLFQLFSSYEVTAYNLLLLNYVKNLKAWA